LRINSLTRFIFFQKKKKEKLRKFRQNVRSVVIEPPKKISFYVYYSSQPYLPVTSQWSFLRAPFKGFLKDTALGQRGPFLRLEFFIASKATNPSITPRNRSGV